MSARPNYKIAKKASYNRVKGLFTLLFFKKSAIKNSNEYNLILSLLMCVCMRVKLRFMLYPLVRNQVLNHKFNIAKFHKHNK